MLITDAGRSVELKAKLFRGLAEASRLGILEALRDGPRTVSEIVSMTGLTQPNASNHLACLLGCGLVAREPLGRFALYRLADERVGSLLSLADEVLSEVARGVYVCPRYETDDREHPVAARRGR
ncbi:MAG: transcriptional regulator [Gemmatimonadetes bacterium]|nr:transcriptional regulator [Gemmatimonadota bacterium]